MILYRRLRADPRFAQQIRGSEVCVHDPRITQQNPRMVQFRSLRITYIFQHNCVCLNKVIVLILYAI